MIGLVLACIGSVFNVLTNVSRKKVLDHQYEATVIGFWCKVVALVCYLAAFGVCAMFGGRLELPPIGAAFHIPLLAGFVLYLLLNALLEGSAILLNYRALQVSPLSLCVPFMALTPVFLLPIGKFFLHERISAGMIVGVALVVIGSLVINRQLVAHGWIEPLKAMFREKGSRYMLIVAFLLACSSALDKWFVTSGGDAAIGVRVARSFTLSIGKSVMLLLFFALLASVRMPPRKRPEAWTAGWRTVPRWLLLSGVFEAVVLVLQLTAVQFAVTAIVISIKRSGILLACFFGWFFFGERGITDRVIGSCVMISGVVVFFLTKPNADGAAMVNLPGAMAVATAALAGMSIALYLTRNQSAPATPPGFAPTLVEEMESEP